MKVTLIRYQTSDQGTRGILVTGSFWCHTLELPWRDNRTNVSCIPKGEYDIQFITANRRIGGIRDMYWFRKVKGRSGILAHPGTWAGDKTQGHKSSVLGCILPGKTIGIYKGQQAIFETRQAVRELHDVLQRQPAKLTILENYNHV